MIQLSGSHQSNNNSNNVNKEDQEDNNNHLEEETTQLVDEECVQLLYSFLVQKLISLHRNYLEQQQLFANYFISFVIELPFLNHNNNNNGNNDDNDNDDDDMEMIVEVPTVRISMQPLPSYRVDEQVVYNQKKALYLAYYIAGQYTILLQALKDIQDMFMLGGQDDSSDHENDVEDDEDDEEDD
jgi:hypothetical protein